MSVDSRVNECVGPADAGAISVATLRSLPQTLGGAAEFLDIRSLLWVIKKSKKEKRKRRTKYEETQGV